MKILRGSRPCVDYVMPCMNIHAALLHGYLRLGSSLFGDNPGRGAVIFRNTV